MKCKKLLVLLLAFVALFAFALTASAQSSDYTGWDYNEDVDGYVYYENGQMLTNKWIKEYDEWYYLGADGARYTNGVYEIGGNLYAFNHGGRLYIDEEFELYDTKDGLQDGYYYAQGGAADGALLTNAWYRDVEEYYTGPWRYYGEDGKAYQSTLATIGGVTYCFDAWADMLEDTAQTVLIDGVPRHFSADENGYATELQNNTWKQINGSWYYVQNNQICESDIYEIDGQYYGFDWSGKMYDDEFFEFNEYIEEEWYYNRYYAKSGGVLARNESVLIDRYDYGYSRPYLFKDDCTLIEEPGLYFLGGNTYCVNEYGSVVYGKPVETENGAYYFDELGIGSKLDDGWFHYIYEDEYNYEYYDHWLYVQDGYLLSDGIYPINGNRYAFNSNGYLITDTIHYDYLSGKFFLATYMDENGNGGSICEETNAWKTYNGDYIYLSEDSSVYHGWLFDTYYMTPYMSYCNYIIDDYGSVYVVNKDGLSTKVTSNGLLNIGYETIYVENGKVVESDWKQVNGSWYYFNEYGSMCCNDSYNIDGSFYYFDSNGKMIDCGWFRDRFGAWYWAGSDGKLFTNAVDGSGYVFAYDGRLLTNSDYYLDGTLYITNADGKYFTKTTQTGWLESNGDWYYVTRYYMDEELSLVKGILRLGDDKSYAFDYTGKMLSNRFYDGYYIGSNGEIVKGWVQVDGYWYYGDEHSGYLRNDGITFINGKEYAFDNQFRLIQNQTYFDWDDEKIITTDSEGIVISRTETNGWAYNAEGTYGYAYYFENGKPYTGWIGNYYISDGRMRTNSIVYDENTDKRYIVDKKGVYVNYGWYEPYDDEWIYAKASGELVYNDWLQLGNTWYYFDGVMMARDGNCYIDGATHAFDENGAWLGKVTEGDLEFSKYADGWAIINGEWYFIMAGESVRDSQLYIDGNWYYFNYDGVMITDTFYEDWEYTGAIYYFTSSGARANYTGWQWIKNSWVYFNDDHTINSGLVFDGKNTYCQIFSRDYDGYTETIQSELATGYRVVDGILYYFNNDGILTATITSSGWYQNNGTWYYVDKNGVAVSGKSKYLIGGTYYAFNYEGDMVANDVYEGRYYDANGALVTAQGWYLLNGEWIYVTSSGYVAGYGVYIIDGVEYYFYDNVWIG